MLLTSKLIDGTFPEYERVIPRGNDKVLRVGKKDFADAVDRVATISAERSRPVKLSLARDLLVLSATSPEQGTATEELDADRVKYEAGPLEIGFQARYLIDITDQIDGEVEFRFADGSRADGGARRGGRQRALRADADAGLTSAATPPSPDGARSPTRSGAGPAALRLRRLALTDFRNYAALTWRPGGADQRAVRAERQRQDQPAGGDLAAGARPRPARRAHCRSARGAAATGALGGRRPVRDRRTGEVDIGTGSAARAAPAERRVFRLDGAAPRSQAEIAARVAAVWLTPQMDRLFLEGASGRRRFLDRLVWALEPGHAREVAAHDAAMAQRNRLLARGPRRPGLAGRRSRTRWRATRWPPRRRAAGAGRAAERALAGGAAAPSRRRGWRWSARSPSGWRRRRRSRSRTGCATALAAGRARDAAAGRRRARRAPRRHGARRRRDRHRRPRWLAPASRRRC